jgi:hypothetical protein
MKVLNGVQLVLGLWVLLSPWLLNFSDVTTALWSNIIAGVLTAILAVWGLYGTKFLTPPVSQ